MHVSAQCLHSSSVQWSCCAESVRTLLPKRLSKLVLGTVGRLDLPHGVQTQNVIAPGNNGAEVVARVEQFGMKLAHQFPWTPAAGVAVGLALRRRFLGDPDAISKLTRRKQIMAVSLSP